MGDFEILAPAPLLPSVVTSLEQRFTLHKLWAAEDREATLAALAPRIRALAVGGGRPDIDAAFMARFPNLRIVANFGVGYDQIDAAWAGRHGIVVTNTPDVLTEEVADTAIGLMIMTARRLSESERYLRAGKWLEKPFPLTAGTLRGKTLGVLGLGRIGMAIARRAEAFGLNILYHNRRPRTDVAYGYRDSAAALARDCDILMAVTPGDATSAKLIDRTVLEALGPQGILINVARGSVVDEEALIVALRDGKIMSAGLDVFAREPHAPQALIDMEEVVLLPHVGSASQHTRNAMGQLQVDNLVSFAAGKGPVTPVLETPWPATRDAAH
jgi:lactate dehydrogenase-like 2-hydroxyacid dehydrogenase